MSSSNSTRKTTCAITRQQYTANAKPVTVAINNQPLSASPKQFSTGSMGWFANGKVSLIVDGIPVQCQVSLNITVIGSKDLPFDTATPSPEVQAIRDTATPKAAASEATQAA
jgi:hypothetical protein